MLLGAADIRSTTKVTIYSNTFYWLNSSDGNHPDIALFRLTKPVTINKKIRPIRLPAKNQEGTSFENLTALIQGYGGGKSVLQYASFKIQSKHKCNFRETQICSTAINFITSTEGGDSGNTTLT